MRFLQPAALALALLFPAPASAGLAIFDHGAGQSDYGPRYGCCATTVESFNLVPSGGAGWGYFGRDNPDRPSPDNVALVIFGPGQMKMQNGNGALRWLTFDLAEFTKDGSTPTVAVNIKRLGASEVNFDLELDGVDGLQSFDFKHLGPVEYFTIAGPAQIDNIGYQLYLATAPEPGTWAMMLLGFAGMGLALRSRSGALRRA